MFDFYQRRKLKTLFTAPITRIVFAVLAILMAYSAFTRYQIAVDMEGRRNEVEADVKRLEEHKASLTEEVRYLSDDRGIEAEMRRQFDVALEHEQVVVIVEPEGGEIKATSTTYEKSPQPAWYEFWR